MTTPAEMLREARALITDDMWEVPYDRLALHCLRRTGYFWTPEYQPAVDALLKANPVINPMQNAAMPPDEARAAFDRAIALAEKEQG